PSEVGGVLGGNLLVTGLADVSGVGNGRALLIDSDGDATVLLNRFGMPFWGPAIAPPDFGDYGGSIFIGVATGAGIYRIDPVDLDVSLFVSVPLVEELRGIRQIAFSPPGWAASLDPELADQSVLVVSVASSLSSNDTIDLGAVMVWDSTGKRVAILTQGAGGINIEPRGLLFVEDDLLISDIAEGHDWLLRATINSFAIPDCDGDGVPDACAIEAGAADCNANGVPDACEPDCNDTGQPDDCDVLDGLSPDCDLNGFPDECEPDNDGDGIPDPCDRAGDFDHDSDVDLDDHELFAICLEVSGPGVSPPFPDCLDVFDFDADGDVDLLDAGGFQRAFTASIP
ncbi:MAG: hypothetical protein IID36_12330, partial [Planctomycetes bacterium]|nr:hypothetical protein [Planctomycetota bacterium]